VPSMLLRTHGLICRKFLKKFNVASSSPFCAVHCLFGIIKYALSGRKASAVGQREAHQMH
jgi:hypothetical protein